MGIHFMLGPALGDPPMLLLLLPTSPSSRILLSNMKDPKSREMESLPEDMKPMSREIEMKIEKS